MRENPSEWDNARVDARVSLARDELLRQKLRGRMSVRRKDIARHGTAHQRKCAGYAEYSLDGRRIAKGDQANGIGEDGGEVGTVGKGDAAIEDARARSRQGGDRDASEEGEPDTEREVTEYDLGIQMEVDRLARRQLMQSAPIHSSLRMPWMPRTGQHRNNKQPGREMPWESVVARKKREDVERIGRERDDERERLLRSKVERMALKRGQSRQQYLAAFPGRE